MRDGCEDWDFWLRVVEQGYRGAIIPEFLFEYRRRADSMSRVMSAGGYPLPLHDVIARHQRYYREHIVEVTARKEDEVADLRREVIRLRKERMLSLEPSIARGREELAAALAKIDRVRPLIELRQDRDRLVSEVARLESERRDLAVRLAHEQARLAQEQARLAQEQTQKEEQRSAMTAEIAGLDARLANATSACERLSAHVSHLDGQIADLHDSLSWRLTEPLRRWTQS